MSASRESWTWKLYKFFFSSKQSQQGGKAVSPYSAYFQKMQSRQNNNWDQRVLAFEKQLANSTLGYKAAVMVAVVMSLYLPYELKKCFDSYGQAQKSSPSVFKLVVYKYDTYFDEEKAAKAKLVKDHFNV